METKKIDRQQFMVLLEKVLSKTALSKTVLWLCGFWGGLCVACLCIGNLPGAILAALVSTGYLVAISS